MRVSVSLPIALDGDPTPSTTTLEPSGADAVLVISTAVPDHALTLRSVYVGAGGDSPGLAITVTHSREGRSSQQRSLAGVPVSHARRLCLTDHAQMLQRALSAQTGAAVSIEITDQANALADSTYPTG